MPLKHRERCSGFVTRRAECKSWWGHQMYGYVTELGSDLFAKQWDRVNSSVEVRFLTSPPIKEIQ